MNVIDLNCDMGESLRARTMDSNTEMLQIVTSANVACGFPAAIHGSCSIPGQAKENGVGIGAILYSGIVIGTT
jgi:5-oxoprolinase (ATP-hydrolysing) subunit A